MIRSERGEKNDRESQELLGIGGLILEVGGDGSRLAFRILEFEGRRGISRIK